jgi:arginase
MFSFLGVIEDSVGRGGGAELAAPVMRELGIVPALHASDVGDLDAPIRGDERDPHTGIVASAEVLHMTRVVRSAVVRQIRSGARPYVMGGCCAAAVGALAGARDALGRLSLVYVDGHQDLYDGRTSDTGEAADMPFGTALGLGPGEWVDAAGGASVDPSSAWLVGFSDQEKILAAGARQASEILPPSRVHSASSVREHGSGQLGSAIRDEVKKQAANSFWLHVDVDVLDGSIFPATDYPAEDGLTWDELTELLLPLSTASHLTGVSIGCYNPERDPERVCGRAFVQMWATLADARRRGG